MSQTFTDKKGRKWIMDITVGTVKRVHKICEIDLMDLGSASFLETAIGNEVELVTMLYTILEKQAKEYKIDEEEFMEGFAGDVIDEATKCFMEGLVSFFRGGKKEAAKKLIAKTNEIAEKTYAMAALRADEINPEEAAQAIFKNLENTTG